MNIQNFKREILKVNLVNLVRWRTLKNYFNYFIRLIFKYFILKLIIK